jgi:hypothetical protein
MYEIKKFRIYVWDKKNIWEYIYEIKKIFENNVYVWDKNNYS